MSNSKVWAPPIVATPSWQSGNCWLANDDLYITDGFTPVRIPLAEIDNILISDASYKKTPGWAVALGIIGLLVFLIGIVCFFIKETVTQTQVTVYREGSATPISALHAGDVGTVQAEWCPILRRVGA